MYFIVTYFSDASKCNLERKFLVKATKQDIAHTMQYTFMN